MNFKTMAIVIVLGGLGYAAYTGKIGDFIGSLGGAMSKTGNAASQVAD